MEQKKSLTDSLDSISDDDLMEVLKGKKVAVGSLRRTVAFESFFQFLKDFNIKRGRAKVKVAGLYRIYKRFSSSDYVLTSHAFTTLIGQIVETTGNGQWVLVNSSSKVCQRAFRYQYTMGNQGQINRHTKRTFHYFAKEYTLLSGEALVPDYALYHLFDKWCYQRKKTTPDFFVFKLLANQRFKSRRMFDGSIQYKLHKDVFNHLSQETIENLRNAQEKKKKAPGPRIAYAGKKS